MDLTEHSLLSAQLDQSILRTAIDIAGLRIELFTRSALLSARLHSFFSDYITTDFGSNRVGPHGQIFLEPLYANSTFEPLWESTDAEYSFSGDFVYQRDFVAKSVRPGLAYAFVAPELDDAFHNLLRWFIPNIALEENRFLLHGAGIICDGAGFVFFGQSGAGKSTSVQMITDADSSASAIGDDAVIVECRGEELFLHSAPIGAGYSREAPPRRSVPIAGFFSIHQDASNFIEKLTASEAAATLLASVMQPQTTNEALLAKLSLAERFVRATPQIARLHFTRSPEFWSMILNSRKKNVQRQSRQKEIEV